MVKLKDVDRQAGRAKYAISWIEKVAAPASNADTYWYTLQGVRIGQKTPTKPGIYIHCGKTVKVK